LSEPQEPRTAAEQEALDAVLAWLRQVPGRQEDPTESWAVYPFQDAQLVCPVTPKRGAPIFLVRRGEVRTVESNRRKTEEDVYRELVAEQG
jgi:hypothetical protein